MKKIIVIVALLLFLAAGGLGGAGYMGKGPLAGMMGKDKAAAEEVAKEPEPPPPPKDIYYELGSYIVPLIAKGGIARQVGVDLAIKVDPKSGPRISADLPRLQNAITLDLYDFLPRHSDSHSPDDRRAVHDRVLKLAVRMYGEDSVHDIIVKSMYER